MSTFLYNSNTIIYICKNIFIDIITIILQILLVLHKRQSKHGFSGNIQGKREDLFARS